METECNGLMVYVSGNLNARNGLNCKNHSGIRAWRRLDGVRIRERACRDGAAL